MSLRALIGAVFCALAACETASFESLGTLSAGQNTSPTRSLDAGPQDVSVAPLQLDAAVTKLPVTSAAAGSSAQDAAVAAGGGGGSGMLPAADSGAANQPDALSGSLDSKPFAVMAGYVSGLSDEFQQTTVYLFDSSVSCSQLSAFAWLSQLPSTTRVLEIKFPAAAQTGSPVSNASVSYMLGGTYSFSKTRASSSTLVLSQVSQGGDVDGALTASFGADTVDGAFHADFCAAGMGL